MDCERRLAHLMRPNPFAAPAWAIIRAAASRAIDFEFDKRFECDKKEKSSRLAAHQFARLSPVVFWWSAIWKMFVGRLVVGLAALLAALLAGAQLAASAPRAPMPWEDGYFDPSYQSWPSSERAASAANKKLAAEQRA